MIISLVIFETGALLGQINFNDPEIKRRIAEKIALCSFYSQENILLKKDNRDLKVINTGLSNQKDLLIEKNKLKDKEILRAYYSAAAGIVLFIIGALTGKELSKK